MSNATHHPSRTKPAEERRGELMNAAQRLFLEQGVGPTTIEQITSAAGVAKGTFYLHFTSKDDIRSALGERFARKHLESVRASMAERPDDDWLGKLLTCTRASVAFYLDLLVLHDMLFHEVRSAPREGLVDNIVIDHLAGLLEAGADAKAWTIDEPRCTAVFLFSGVHAIVDDAVLRQRQVDRDRLMKVSEQLCSRTVGLG